MNNKLKNKYENISTLYNLKMKMLIGFILKEKIIGIYSSKYYMISAL
jgi:hypothetical protein